MNAAPMKIKNVIRVFSESDIPDHMMNEVKLMRAEFQAKQPAKAMQVSQLAIPSTPRAEFLEPISPVGIVPLRVSAMMVSEYEKKNMEEYLHWEIQQPSTWLKQIEVFENQRSKITKKGKLSASDLDEMDELDEKIKYCEDVLADLENDYFEDSE